VHVDSSYMRTCTRSTGTGSALYEYEYSCTDLCIPPYSPIRRLRPAAVAAELLNRLTYGCMMVYGQAEIQGKFRVPLQLYSGRAFRLRGKCIIVFHDGNSLPPR
jgi:hypothetical protein